MKHYKYRTPSTRLMLHTDPPDPIEPPGAGWELVSQCACAVKEYDVRLFWSWRQVAFETAEPPPAEPKGPGS